MIGGVVGKRRDRLSPDPPWTRDPGSVRPLDARPLSPPGPTFPTDEPTTRNSVSKPASGLSAQSYHTRSFRLQPSIFHRSSGCRAGQAPDLIGERRCRPWDPWHSPQIITAWTSSHLRPPRTSCSSSEPTIPYVGRPCRMV
ncbi:MAG: hypothetical protein UT43_C0026G0004 [Parcubacteria group bacterium GW2011_GWC1_39_29]|nr:MAG: hypothetical protein UT43_C0026G0004 [Parcubacteria group bacterium GW2011_GWC1_39_29]